MGIWFGFWATLFDFPIEASFDTAFWCPAHQLRPLSFFLSQSRGQKSQGGRRYFAWSGVTGQHWFRDTTGSFVRVCQAVVASGFTK